MAQPALSQQIKTLEDRLGVLLFSRANRRLTLTPAGEAFLSKARVAILMTDQAILDARQTARGEQGVLNLGCVSSAIFDSKLPAALRLLHEKWPAISLSMMTGNVQTLYTGVQTTSWMWPLFVPRYRYCLTICKAVHLQRKRPCWPYLVNIAWRAPPR